MIDRTLEGDLQRHFHDRLDGELAPATLASRVVVIPRQRHGGRRFWPALRASRPALLAAIVLLLTLLLVGGWVVGSELLRSDEQHSPTLPALRACDLLAAGSLSSQFGMPVDWRGDDGTSDWWPYSWDWHVPREARAVLGSTTSGCSFASKPNLSQVGHLELFVRNRVTTHDQAGLLVAALFEPSSSDGPAASALPLESSASVAGFVTWRTDNGAHHAGAVLVGPYLVVVSATYDFELDVLLDLVVAEVVRNLEGR